jgi:hypothetical protein
MTVVIADTSPLNYLILLGELIDDGASGQAPEWAMKLPQWAGV